MKVDESKKYQCLKDQLAVKGYTAERVIAGDGFFFGMRVLNPQGDQIHKSRVFGYRRAELFLSLTEQMEILLKCYVKTGRVECDSMFAGMVERIVIALMAGDYDRALIESADSQSGKAVKFRLDRSGVQIIKTE